MASTDVLTGQTEEAIGGTYGDVAQQRRGTADDLRSAATAIANGDIETAKQLIMQIIAVQATATDQNFRAQLQLETVQGSIGNMFKIFGSILKGFGAEEFGQQLIDIANDPNLTLNPVSPDMRALEALENNTNLSPELRSVVTGVITDIGGTARAQAARTGNDVDDQITTTNRDTGRGGSEEPAATDGSTAPPRTVSFTRDEMQRAAREMASADAGEIEDRIVGSAFTRNAGRDGIINSPEELAALGAEIRTSALTPAQQNLFRNKMDELAYTP